MTPRTAHRIDPTAQIYPNAWIGPDVTIGAGCIIGPGAVIGFDGFGYDPPDHDGRRAWRDHPYGVIIEDDVHIGANTCIDRGRHRDTVIRQGARIDNLVHIAHNVHIGRNVVVIAHAMLAGTTDIGDDAYIAPGAQICDHVTIGERSMVGLGSVVLEDVPEGEVWAGTPARKLRDR